MAPLIEFSFCTWCLQSLLEPLPNSCRQVKALIPNPLWSAVSPNLLTDIPIIHLRNRFFEVLLYMTMLESHWSAVKFNLVLQSMETRVMAGIPSNLDSCEILQPVNLASRNAVTLPTTPLHARSEPKLWKRKDTRSNQGTKANTWNLNPNIWIAN